MKKNFYSPRMYAIITVLWFAHSALASSNYLTPIPSTGLMPVPAGGDEPFFGTYSPDSKFYATAFFDTSGSPAVFSVNSTTGALTPITQTNPITPQETYGAVFSPFINGAYYVATSNFDPTVSVFSVNQDTGILTEVTGSPFTNPGASESYYSITYAPNGKWLAIPNSGGSSITTFEINQSTGVLFNGTATPVTGLSANGPGAVAYSPDGRFMAIASYVDNNVLVCSVDQTTGVPSSTPVWTVPSAQHTWFIAYSPDGKWCAASSEEGSSNNLYLYSVDATSGQLTSVTANPYTLIGADSGSVAFSPDSTHLAVAGLAYPGYVFVFSISGSGAAGTLTQVAGSPFGTVDNETYSVSFSSNNPCSSNNLWLAAVNEGSNSISTFKVAYTPPSSCSNSYSNNLFAADLQAKYGPILAAQ